MDRFVLAFWILLAGFGFFGFTIAQSNSNHTVQAMDGGLIPPMK
jgi:hypothetical protein